MKCHYLSRTQMLPIGADVAWAFFANPANLLQLTPPEMRMVNESIEQPNTVFPGLIQVYRVRLPVIGLPGRWVAEITHLEAPRRFTDEQKLGPFAFWQHCHELIPVEGGVQVRDSVHYAMPFGPWGELAHTLFVERQLRAMFDYRARMLEEFFGPG